MTTDTRPARSRPFHDLLGIHSVEAGDGRSVVEMYENPSLGNSRGEVHGGAVFGLLDVACGNAALSSLPNGAGAVTVSLTVTYLAAGRGKLTARGLVLRSGKTIIAVEAEARDEQGTLIAKAHGTMRAFTSRR